MSHRTELPSASSRARWSMPRGLAAGMLAALALVWGPYLLIKGSSLLSALVQTTVYAALLVLTVSSRRVKVLVVRTFQRWTINPLMRLLLTIGVNPLGLAILETRGRKSGKPRRVPVGNGRKGDSFWTSPSTACARTTCATSPRTREFGSGCGSVCATAG